MIGLVLLSACNSDRPEPADVDLPTAGITARITRTATHPFLARYRLILQVEGRRVVQLRPSYSPIQGTPDDGICINKLRRYYRPGSVRRASH